MLWTSLPLAAWYGINNDSSALLVLLGTFGLAWILRVTVSWEATLAAAVLVAAASSLVFEIASAQVMTMIVDWYLEVLSQMEQRLTPEQAKQVLTGFFALGQAFAMILALVVARWWQSLLYNPGGFAKEFHLLRVSPKLSVAILVLMIAFFVMGNPALSRWIPLLTVPLILPAIGFVHWFVSEKKLSTSWLVSFYLLLVLMVQLVYPVLVSLALLDSWTDFRKRFRTDDEE
jgi:hypothetical protein